MPTQIRLATPNDLEGILFIRRAPPSLRAHEKMGMLDVARFIFNGQAHAVFSYIG